MAPLTIDLRTLMSEFCWDVEARIANISSSLVDGALPQDPESSMEKIALQLCALLSDLNLLTVRTA